MNMKDIRTANKHIELQHRHFCLIAATLRDSKPAEHWDANKMVQWQSIVNEFVAACRRSNGRFDADRFLTACNYEPPLTATLLNANRSVTYKR
jgi:hypothetical protein